MLKKEFNLENISHKAIVYFFAILQIAILADIIIFSDSTWHTCKKEFLFPNSIIFILSLVFCIACFVVYKQGIQNNIRVNLYLCLIIANVLLFGVQIFITFHMYFYTGWDVKGIRTTVNDIIQNGGVIGAGNYYSYSIYPNNVNLTAVLLIIEKSFLYFGLNGYYGSLIVSNLLVNLAGIFTFLSTYNITSRYSYAVFSWIMFVLVAALSPWISIPYSDTYSIVFPILAFYLYISRKPDKTYYIRWFLIGFLCLFGYTIKPTVIIVLIAILIIEFLEVLTRFEKKTLINKLFPLILIIAAALPVLLINSLSKKLMGVELDKNREFQIYHFAMMGLNTETNGVYSGDDVNFSASFATIEERNNANISVIQERLTNFGLLGYVKFLGRKALINFSDGSFAWSCEGNFYNQIPKRDGIIATFLRNLYYQDGAYYTHFLTYTQILWFIILILLPGMGLFLKKPEYKSITVILAIVGISFFVMLLEARARYLYNYLSFFAIGAGIGASSIKRGMNILKQRAVNRK